MDMEAQTNENTRNITSLTATVTELSTIMKFEVERGKEDRSSVKDMVNELKSLNEKITTMAGVQKEQAQATNAITELRTKMERLDKFDFSKMENRLEGLEKINTKEEGVKSTLTTGLDWFWRLFGNAITCAITAALVYGITHDVGSTTTYMEKHVRGQITGE